MDCVSCASGQTICLDALESTHRPYQWTPRTNTMRKRLEKLVLITRMSHAVRWLRPLLCRPGPLRRPDTSTVRRGAPRCQVRTGASPYGFGRMLIRQHGRPEAYWADSLSDGELSCFRPVKGDPAWQVEWGTACVF